MPWQVTTEKKNIFFSHFLALNHRSKTKIKHFSHTSKEDCSTFKIQKIFFTNDKTIIALYCSKWTVCGFGLILNLFFLHKKKIHCWCFHDDRWLFQWYCSHWMVINDYQTQFRMWNASKTIAQAKKKYKPRFTNNKIGFDANSKYHLDFHFKISSDPDDT